LPWPVAGRRKRQNPQKPLKLKRLPLHLQRLPLKTKTQQRQRPKTKMQPHLLLRLLSLQRSNQYPGFILSLTLGMSGQAGQTPAFLLSALYDLPVEAIILLGDD
jgi:hypothetical protein